MADDLNPAFRAEITAARAVLAPQLRGLRDILNDTISAEAHAEVSGQIVVKERRDGLLSAMLAAMDGAVGAREALELDGYPVVPTAKVSDAVLAELRGEVSDVQAAAAVFVVDSAVSISVGLGEPVSKL